MTRPDWNRETGASLVSALLLVAVMASLAMALAGDLRFSMRRSANMDVRDQAYWYALGAREFSQSLVESAMRDPAETLRPDAGWLSDARVFSIEGGQLVGRIRDGNNCFNLNSLVVADGQGGRRGDPVQQRRLEFLMRALDIPAAEAARVAAQAVDWIDSDNRPVAGGGEDDLYQGYRPANALMVETAELLALEAVNSALYERLRPHVCVRPVAEPVALNINTLQNENWPQLFALFEGELSRVAIDGILLARPADGFASAEAFWALEAVRPLDPDAVRRQMVGTDTRYFEIEIDVSHAGQVFGLTALLDASGGRVRRLSQTYGSLS